MSPKVRLQLQNSNVNGFLLLVSFIIVAFFPPVANAETEIQMVLVEIRDLHEQPIEGVRVKCRGHSQISYPSTSSGLAELPLPPGAQAGDQVDIELEPGSDLSKKWTFLQPFGGNINVPSPKQRYYRIVLVQRDHLESMLKKAPTSRFEERKGEIDRFDRPPPMSTNKIRKPKH